MIEGFISPWFGRREGSLGWFGSRGRRGWFIITAQREPQWLVREYKHKQTKIAGRKINHFLSDQIFTIMMTGESIPP